MIYESITQLIGNTPLFRPINFCNSEGAGKDCDILCKLEYLNPAGRIKDRAALSMIEEAERRGILKKGSVIIESTSGNTGIGLAAIGASRGYKVILTMPDTMSIERRRLLAAYGAEIVLTEGALGMKGAIDKANELSEITGLPLVLTTVKQDLYDDLKGEIQNLFPLKLQKNILI